MPRKFLRVLGRTRIPLCFLILRLAIWGCWSSPSIPPKIEVMFRPLFLTCNKLLSLFSFSNLSPCNSVSIWFSVDYSSHGNASPTRRLGYFLPFDSVIGTCGSGSGTGVRWQGDWGGGANRRPHHSLYSVTLATWQRAIPRSTRRLRDRCLGWFFGSWYIMVEYLIVANFCSGCIFCRQRNITLYYTRSTRYEFLWIYTIFFVNAGFGWLA